MKGKFQFDWSNLEQLINNGHTLRDIGRIKGCSHDAVRKAINRINLVYEYDKSSIAKRIAIDMDYKTKFSGQKVTRIVITCDYCDGEYEKLECQLKNEHHFCSIHCKAKWIGEKSQNDIDYKEKQRQIALKNGTKPPLKIGKDHWNWKGGISKLKLRDTGEYDKWRKYIFSKDNYTCGICKIRGGRLSSHHIKEWALYPELRYNIDNGQCLCYDCHMDLHGLKKKTA
jgi:hypothetical protein